MMKCEQVHIEYIAVLPELQCKHCNAVLGEPSALGRDKYLIQVFKMSRGVFILMNNHFVSYPNIKNIILSLALLESIELHTNIFMFLSPNLSMCKKKYFAGNLNNILQPKSYIACYLKYYSPFKVSDLYKMDEVFEIYQRFLCLFSNNLLPNGSFRAIWRIN